MSRLLKGTAHFLARRLDTWGRKNQADRLIRAEGPFEELSPYNGRCERCARKGSVDSIGYGAGSTCDGAARPRSSPSKFSAGGVEVPAPHLAAVLTHAGDP
jgi:hypothetical protein